MLVRVAELHEPKILPYESHVRWCVLPSGSSVRSVRSTASFSGSSHAMEWTIDQIFLFVELLKGHPCLWDSSSKDKRNRNKVEHAYRSIADLMKMDLAKVKKKKETLFQTYRNYKRKISRRKASGSDSSEVYKPSWVPYVVLDEFLHDVYTPKKKCDLLTVSINLLFLVPICR